MTGRGEDRQFRFGPWSMEPDFRLPPDVSEEEREAFRRFRQRWVGAAALRTTEPAHDPLCEEHMDSAYYCICDLVRRARAEGAL